MYLENLNFLNIEIFFMDQNTVSIQSVISNKSGFTCTTFEMFFPSWIDKVCSLKVDFSAKLASQKSHLKTTVVTKFGKICGHKLHIWKVYIFHELMQHFDSRHPFEKICSHKLLIEMTFSSWMQYVFSRHLFEKIGGHKLHIWTAYFLHGLMQHACSSHAC